MPVLEAGGPAKPQPNAAAADLSATSQWFSAASHCPLRFLWLTSLPGFSRADCYFYSSLPLTPSTPKTRSTSDQLWSLLGKFIHSQGEKVQVKFVGCKVLEFLKQEALLFSYLWSSGHLGGCENNSAIFKWHFTFRIEDNFLNLEGWSFQVIIKTSRQSVNRLSCDPYHSFLQD